MSHIYSHTMELIQSIPLFLFWGTPRCWRAGLPKTSSSRRVHDEGPRRTRPGSPWPALDGTVGGRGSRKLLKKKKGSELPEDQELLRHVVVRVETGVDSCWLVGWFVGL